MAYLLHHLIQESAQRLPEAAALLAKEQVLDYASLWERVWRSAAGLQAIGLEANDRVAVYLPKQPEAVEFMFATVAANGVFVPVNPVLRPEQVEHILGSLSIRKFFK